MPSPRHRLLQGVAVVLALGLAYGLGVVTGVVGVGVAPVPVASPGVLDEAADRIAADAARPVDRDELERAAVEGMLAALGDRYSRYLPSSEVAGFTAVLDGRYTGVGLWVRRDADGALRVSSVGSATAAAAAGVAVGDEVVSVDGQPVAGRSVADAVAALRGAPGTPVRLELRSGDATRRVELTRSEVADGDVTVDHVAPDVARIRVAAFTRGTGHQVRDALAAQRLAQTRGVVLDLRDNPGGLLDEAVEVASAFLDGGPVVSYERRDKPTRRLDAVGTGDVTTPLVVLVDGGTASAAEVVAAALQDRRRAVVVGSRTFGKGSVQEPTRLADGSALELTVGRYRTPAGRTLDGAGLDPDIEVGAAVPPGTAETRAVEVLTGLLADTGATGRG